ncbi:hypothetical protein SAMN05660862_0986 [Sphingobacterium psychroaquaticum]|uniref:TerB family tellurite resistance protein n=2 Tax=Sphingobacterium psychroaquaticum TaxID=561061 RepID=A0A1X7IM71_9SPHI|nr:hypothetical protein SAMN05660862_0986 [Sphingobacterium psychroaquaticum]
MKTETTKVWRVLLPFMLTAMFAPNFLSAQTFNEFFRQKSTQRKYLLEQIVALRTYASVAKRSYDIARDGLNIVRGFTSGELGLHDLFFSGLQTINPIVRNNPKIAEILAMQRTTAKLINNLRYPGQLRREQRDYLMNIKRNLIKECERNMDELLLITSADMTSMDDASRLEKLNTIHREATDKMLFARWLAEELETWRIVSQSEDKSLQKLRRLYD